DSMAGSVSGLPDPVANASLDSVDSAHVVAAQVSGDTASSLIASADQAFVSAMGSTTHIAAAVALAGALVALPFPPSRGKSADGVPVEEDVLHLDVVEQESTEPVLV